MLSWFYFISGLFVSQMVNFKETIPSFTLESYMTCRVLNNFVYVDQLPARVRGDSQLHVASRYNEHI